MGRRLCPARGRRFAGLALPSGGGGRRFRPDFAATAGPTGPTRWGLGREALGRARVGPAQFARPPARASQAVSLSSAAPLGAAALAATRRSVRAAERGRAFFRPALALPACSAARGAWAKAGFAPFGNPTGSFFTRFFPSRPRFFRPDIPAPPLPPLFFVFLACVRRNIKKNGRGPLLRSLPDRMRRGGEAQGRIRSGLNPIRSRGRKTDSACRFSRRFRRRL